jgi:DNA-binding NarL/FixJ family response regulator
MTNEATIREALVEDRREIREGLALIINATPGFVCTGAYRTMEDALARIGDNLPDVVLNDIGLPGMSGIEGIRILKERHPALLVLMLTVYDDDERIFDALCAGASGYLLKKTQPARLLESLREAVAGGAPMSPEVARHVIALFRDFRPSESAKSELTPTKSGCFACSSKATITRRPLRSSA